MKIVRKIKNKNYFCRLHFSMRSFQLFRSRKLFERNTRPEPEYSTQVQCERVMRTKHTVFE